MKLRTLAKILGGLVAFIILALVMIPFFISADYLKGQLVAQVKEATGRDLIINGEASLKLFPNIAVSVEDVTLGNPAGFKGPYFVRIMKLETGAALRPLLNKQLVITGITLEGAGVNLEEAANGAKNWEFPVEKAKQETKENLQKDKQSSSPMRDFKLGDVHLKDVAVAYLKPGAKPLAVKDITLDIRGADGSQPLKVDGAFTYQDQPVKLRLEANELLAALNGKGTPVTLDLGLPGSTIGFKGTAAMADAPKADGALSVSISDLPKLLGWATGKPAAAGLPKKIDLNATLAMKGMNAIALSDMTLAVDDLAAKGAIAANLAGKVPAIKGALALGTVNLDTFTKQSSGGAAAANKPAAPSANVTEGWSNAPIDLSGLRAANVNLDLSIAALKAANLDISEVKAAVALLNGVLKLNLAQAKLYGGTAKGVVHVDGSGAAAAIATDLTLSGIKIDPLMTALSGKSRLEGTATLNLALTGRGASEQAIVNSLNGKGAMSVKDGAVKGINIANFLRNAKKGFLFSADSAASTDFTELSASYTIAQGVLSNSDLAMKSPVLRLAGSGTVSLPQRSLNYRLVPTLVGTLEGQGGKEAAGLAVPLLITGPWSNPSVTPDLAGMVQEGLKNPEALKQNLKDIKGTIKNFNSPKDIGKALIGGQASETVPAADAPAGTEAAPAKPLTKEEKIQQGIGGLLNTLNKK